MFRFFQRLGCCNPSTDVLTTDSGQERLDSNTATYSSHSFRNNTKHSRVASKPVTPQDRSADPVPQSLPSNSRTFEHSSGPALQDTHHSSKGESTHTVLDEQQNANGRGTEPIGSELHSNRSTGQVVEQGPVTMFQNAQHLNFSGHVRIMNIGHQHVNGHGNYSLDNLKEFVSFSALHDSSAQDPERCCHPGTRKNVLDQMRTWTDDPNMPERILWLHGPAGVGKSAIAQTISYSYGRDKVGASFFFFRSDPTRNDGNRLFPTLAWRLASSVPLVKDHIAFSLEEDPDLPRKVIETQFEQLIAQPFLTLSGGESAALTPLRVIIIDGLDECSDVKLQRRILKIIGNAIANARFPLRFIISSRPEAHIEDFFSQFEHPTLPIDLANIDDAYRDIETYLMSEFARIAVEQELDPEVWPGQEIIDTLISDSSGQFVYASTIIKYTGDEYESAVAQLNVILGLRLCTGKSPFAQLDALYTEILQRQPDQDFLKDFLAVIVACSALFEEDLHEDYAMLLSLDKKELDRKLRGMHSLLKSKPFIDIHHKSFLDFLQDSSRSGEHHVSKHFANRRYMELITNVLVKAASRAMEQDDPHENDHFMPRFSRVVRDFLPVELPLDGLERILQPLQIIQEKLVQLPHMSLPWKPRACDKCWTFYIIDDLLLHLAWLRGSIQSREPKHQRESKHLDIHLLTAIEEKQRKPQLDLDSCLSSLLANLRGVESQLWLNADTIGFMRALVHFDPTETAMKVRSMTDAQNVVELIFCLNKNECFKTWFGAGADNATRLALAIYGRVPVLPRSLFLNSANFDEGSETYQGKAVKFWICTNSVQRESFDSFMWGSLSHANMGPLLGICSSQLGMVMVLASPENGTLLEWRQSSSVSKVQEIVFEVAKAIQYIHSLGIVFSSGPNVDEVYLDSDNHARVLCPGFLPNNLCKGRFDYDEHVEYSTSEAIIRSLGLLFYQVLFNEEVYDIPVVHPREPEIPNNVWQLIQWCCANDPKARPTIDQVVQEMESWISLGQFTLSL